MYAWQVNPLRTEFHGVRDFVIREKGQDREIIWRGVRKKQDVTGKPCRSFRMRIYWIKDKAEILRCCHMILFASLQTWSMLLEKHRTFGLVCVAWTSELLCFAFLFSRLGVLSFFFYILVHFF